MIYITDIVIKLFTMLSNVIFILTFYCWALWDAGWPKIKITLASIWMKQGRLKAYTIDIKIPKY